MFVLDTDKLTLLQAGNRAIARNKSRFQSAPVATTIINRIEILRGRFEYVLKADSGAKLQHACDLLKISEALIAGFTILPVTETASEHFDRLRHEKKLKRIGRADLLITCIALAHRATLVTRNLKHFQQIPGLALENWAD